MRKCKGIGETASVEVAEEGLGMTRARTTLAAAVESTERKRKVRGGELEVSRSEVQQKSMRVATVPDNSASPATSENLSCASISSIRVLAPCCSSSGLSEVDKESFKFLDLENENEASAEEVATSTGDLVDCNERVMNMNTFPSSQNEVQFSSYSKEKIPSSELQSESGELESTARPHEVSSRRRPETEKMPSEAELEEFFAAAEKDLQKQFIDKYNYDIVKDEPLEGRYEWVQLQVKP